MQTSANTFTEFHFPSKPTCDFPPNCNQPTLMTSSQATLQLGQNNEKEFTDILSILSAEATTAHHQSYASLVCLVSWHLTCFLHWEGKSDNFTAQLRRITSLLSWVSCLKVEHPFYRHDVPKRLAGPKYFYWWGLDSLSLFKSPLFVFVFEKHWLFAIFGIIICCHYYYYNTTMCWRIIQCVTVIKDD